MPIIFRAKKREVEIKLTAKFALYSLFVILVIGAITGYILTLEIRQLIFNDFVERTIITQNSVLTHEVKKSDFLPGNTRLAGEEFENAVKKNILSKDLILVKIWRNDGTVLYSNDGRLTGKKFKPKENLSKALSGKVAFEESNLSEEENIFEKPKYGSLLEIYSPIKFNGKTVGAFENYYSLDPVRATQRRISLYTYLLLTGGLGFLWLTLSGIVRGASITIEQQNDGLIDLANRLSNSLEQLKENYLGTISSLAIAVEARDPHTAGHTDRTGSLCVAVSRRLGLTDEQITRTQRAAELHDIGKIGTPETILAKKGKLSPSEWERMTKHSVVGATIVEAIPLLRDVAPIIKHHHEHFNGMGYPDGLIGDQIPIEARILTVVDSFDAMTSDRPYRRALPLETAFSELERFKNTQFDPKVVDAFIASYKSALGEAA